MAGNAVVERVRETRRVLSDQGLSLTTIQQREPEIGVEVVKNLYGWSVRYASGLHNFELLASARLKDVDGSIDDAIKWASAWVNEDPSIRYAFVRK